jgi:hypothetical protein
MAPGTKSDSGAGGALDAGRPNRSRNRLRTDWTALTTLSGIRETSAGGETSECRRRFTPNGRSVSARTSRIAFRTSSGEVIVEPRMPLPVRNERHHGLPFVAATYTRICSSSTGSGTGPLARIASWNERTSNRGPSSVSAMCRSSRIFSSPIL